MQESGHIFLARMGKTKLRPGGIDATNWLLDKANIKPDSKILEVACNMGMTMIQIAKTYGCHVIGIDLDETALDKARKKIRKNHLEDKLSVRNGNAFDLPFADASFDIVINEAMLTMLVGKDKDRALTEYARVLKPGGILLTHDVLLLQEDSPKAQQELLSGLSRAINAHVEPLTLEGWKEKIESHAFRTEQNYGKMTLLDPIGMLHDEGLDGTLKIMTNAIKKENRQMFSEMFDFFNEHATQLGYIANYSIKL